MKMKLASLKDESCSDDSDEAPAVEAERDEVKEVEKMSERDTFKIRLWRFVVTCMLLLTAVAVTLTTYSYLKEEQKNNFVTAFEQFSRTLGDNAISQQRDIRDGYSTFANIISAYAQSGNLSWPFVTLPLFETYGRKILMLSHTEVFCLFPLVTRENRDSWLQYAEENYKEWIHKGHELEQKSRLNPVDYHPFISRRTPGGFVEDVNRDFYFAGWQYSPPPATYGLVNWNVASVDGYDDLIEALLQLRNETLVSKVRDYVARPATMTKKDHDKMHSQLEGSHVDHPHSFVFHPIHEKADDPSSEIVALTASGVAWDFSLRNLLPDGDRGRSKVAGILCVIKNNCNQSFSYEIDGNDAFFKGMGDMHDPRYDGMEVEVNLALHTHPNFTTTPGHCQFSMHIYPTSRFRESYDSNSPEIFSGIVAATFATIILVFFVYDMFVERRNRKLIFNAARSNAIVSSLFPGNIRDRLIGPGVQRGQSLSTYRSSRGSLMSFLSNGTLGDDQSSGFGTRPLADLFLETTVLFADIVGFTAWSSVREPSQVFILLETVYSAFDLLAKNRRVFKVETVGDCYVAVTGLPEPSRDHAIRMIRFARDIMMKMDIQTRKLEVTLGPDTCCLSLRIGIHSGPVTGGVLRGERSRFQLFGDTMNTAARMERTSRSGRIHLSKETADLLACGGKGDWVSKREDTVTAIGKGDLETYWATLHSESDAVSSRMSQSSSGEVELENDIIVPLAVSVQGPGISEKTARLIDWNVEMLLRLLKQVIARRNAITPSNVDPVEEIISDDILEKGETFLDEVREIIALPEFNSKVARTQQDPEQVQLPPKVIEQLQHYVTCIAGMYRENPFHNFDHASHVVMSVIKLMSRIVAPSHLELDVFSETTPESQQKKKIAATLHDHTYGITSDPLTQFACAISALIHDVDHTGVPNAQLIKENAAIAALYNNRSVAEQNSLHLSWDLLMQDTYVDLRAALFPSKAELIRFRQLVVNSVMATDIVDKDLKALRNGRWDKAFKEKGGEKVSGGLSEQDEQKIARDNVNRKATVVIEHLIQASDVSHTMQHWHVYRKWNENLFHELYEAYLAGRADKDPSEFWYKGEIGFFDFYIIPLAKKLKNCGVFGVSSDEFLNYAMKNRQEWEVKGEEVVAEMMDAIKTKSKNKIPTSNVDSVEQANNK